MTEKRFTYKHFDWLQWHIYDNNKYLVEVSGNEKEDIKPLVDLLNTLNDENEQLKRENKHLRCTIESNSQDDYIDYLEKQNERLKERIEELASNDKIVFMNG